ncbi:hypothetical protein L1987_37191 [Smallanthus sonchifolius]|uniref:Uncharacterized protein n=1 Tax=Smallanthus sonchifolius TaxID=185202 RepID=A0ACB9HF91_9ASTR|nr:hypothetical protein L1987_37191 [Smallanthus sonchifolius]
MIHYSGMRSWREIARIPAYPISGKGVFARGRLHWLVNHNDGGKIVWFDVKTEEFGLMDGPKPKGDIEHQLVDLNGEVGFAYIGDHIELWISKAEEWVLHCWFDLDLPPYHYAVVSGCWNKEGDVLLSINSYRGEVKRLVVYTLKSGDLREVVGWGDPCEAEIVMYPNSLFPIQGIYKKCLFD